MFGVRKEQIDVLAIRSPEMVRAKVAFDLRRKGISASVNGERVDVEDAAGGTASIKLGKNEATVTSGENRKTVYSYDADGQIGEIASPGGLKIQYGYDPDGRLTSIRRGEHGAYRFGYHPDGSLARVQYPDQSACEFHRSDGVETSTYPDGGKTIREYNSEGLESSFQDPEGNVTRTRYRGFNAPSTVFFPDGTRHDFEYTPAGHLKRMLVDKRTHAEYSMDEAAGSVKIDFADGSFSSFSLERGKIVAAENEFSRVRIEYDSRGRVVSEDINGRVTAFQRDNLGNLVGIVTPDGKQIVYERDKEHRVKKIIDWHGRVYGVAYHENGAFAGVSYPNGVRLEASATEIGLMETLSVVFPSGNQDAISQSWRYDCNDRAISEKSGSDESEFRYDLQGRLTEIKSTAPHCDRQFELDANGNIAREDGRACRINCLNQYIVSLRVPWSRPATGGWKSKKFAPAISSIPMTWRRTSGRRRRSCKPIAAATRACS